MHNSSILAQRLKVYQVNLVFSSQLSYIYVLYSKNKGGNVAPLHKVAMSHGRGRWTQPLT